MIRYPVHTCLIIKMLTVNYLHTLTCIKCWSVKIGATEKLKIWRMTNNSRAIPTLFYRDFSYIWTVESIKYYIIWNIVQYSNNDIKCNYFCVEHGIPLVIIAPMYCVWTLNEFITRFEIITVRWHNECRYIIIIFQN